MTKTALYIRVSTEEQALHGLSLEAQEQALTEYAKAHGLTVVGVYRDEGITARKRLANRKEFQRLISDVKADKIDLILVTKLDRWFRNIRDYYSTQEVLEKHNCNWQTIFEEYNTTTSSGRLHINIMLSVAQDECDRTSERIKVVFDKKVASGEVTSSSVSLGYMVKDKKLVKNPEEEELVNDFFNYFLINNSVRGTAMYINNKYNTNISYTTAKRMLKRDTYRGIRHENTNFCEPYITAEQYATIQDILNGKNTRKRTNNRVYAYSQIIKCAECGHSCSGNYDPRRKHARYRCEKAFNGFSCSNRTSLSEPHFDNAVIKAIQDGLKDHIAKAEVKPVKATTKSTEKQKAKLQSKIGKLKELYLNDLITLEEYKTDKKAFEEELAKLEEEKPVQVKGNIQEAKKLLSLDVKELFSVLEPGEKQALIRSVVDSITIDANKNISVNFKK